MKEAASRRQKVDQTEAAGRLQQNLGGTVADRQQAEDKNQQQKLDKDQLQDCLDYLSAHPVFAKLLDGFRKKYYSYGRLTGTITLELAEEEVEILEGFLQKSLRGRTPIRISYMQFKKAWEKTRFSYLALEKVMEAYQHRQLIGKEQEQEAVCREKERILHLYSQEDPYAAGKAYRLCTDSLRQVGNIGEWGKQFQLVYALYRGVQSCRSKRQLMALPVFAAKITGDPHGLDHDRRAYRLLLKVLRDEEQHANPSRSTEAGSYLSSNSRGADLPAPIREQRLLYRSYLAVDALSNYVIVCGMEATDRRGTRYMALADFAARVQPIHVTLSMLMDIGTVTFRGKHVYAVENPSVFSSLVPYSKAGFGLVCIGGQPRLAVYLLLDLLAAAQIHLHYGGDMDPEGIGIADRLAVYYERQLPGHFHLWHMTPGDYMDARSPKQISDRRIAMLDHLQSDALRSLADAVRTHRQAAYQEHILDRYLQDVAIPG